jgi:hypothetical protein
MQKTGALVASRLRMLQAFARFGYAAKGVVYMLIAALAMGAALGSGRTGDSREAIGSLSDKPFGKLLLAIVGGGLLAYGLWRIYSGLANPEGDKFVSRLTFVLTGLVNSGIAIEALRVALMNRTAETGNQAPHWTAEVMSKPFGGWMVIAGGAVFAGYGIKQIIKAAKAKLDDQLRLGQLEPHTRGWVIGLARTGIAARGVVFTVIALFLIKAGLDHDPSQARDLGAALQEVQQQPFGTLLLATVGAGLFLYGFYNLVRARYRAIRT